MTYFQEEMIAHMRYQISKEDNIPFFLSARYRVIDLERSNMESGYARDTEYASNFVGNAIVNWQTKINDMWYIPVFAATAGGRIYGTPDAGTLILDNRPMDDGFIDENVSKYLFGSGLFFNGKTIKGGFYAGYCLEYYTTDNSGVIEHKFSWEREYYYQEEDVWKHSLKIALLPALDTSNWKYVGNILNTVFGYIGMGDAVGVYAGEEEDKTIGTIVNTLNYALDLGFRKLEFAPCQLNTRLFYRRDNYDAMARANTYGAVLNTSFSKLPFGIEGEFGFRHFYSVSKYFQSRYPNAWFFSAGLSFSNFKSKNLFQKPWFNNISLLYKYDTIAKHSIVFSADLTYLGAFVFELGFGKESYNTGNYDVTEESFTIGIGFKFIWDVGGVL
jgi:hypothetical protein